MLIMVCVCDFCGGGMGVMGIIIFIFASKSDIYVREIEEWI